MHGLSVNPWPHLVVDDFLSDEALQLCRADLFSQSYEFEVESRGTGRIEYSPLASKALWRAIYSARTIFLLREAFHTDVTLNKDNMLQLRRMNDDTPEFPRHNDSTSKGQSVASFLYLSPVWTKDRGGHLHLYKSEGQSEPSASIEPIENRFVAFRTEPSHWHSVARVHGWERLSVLALWDIK